MPESKGAKSGKGGKKGGKDTKATVLSSSKPATTQQSIVGGDTSLKWLPIDRVRAEDLTYERFLREYALPGKPFIVSGAGDSWRAMHTWSLAYFASEEAGLDQQQLVPTFRGLGELSSRKVRPLGEVLADMQQRQQQGPQDAPIYIRDWEYTAVQSLVDDLGVPHWFDRAPAALHNSTFGTEGPPHKWRWLYIGEAGSGSATHTDPLDSAAWLFCVRGQKRWRAVHAEDFAMVSRLGGEDLPDLFHPNTDKFPGMREARLYEGYQEAGDVMFNPSLCVHAIVNTAPSMSVTHNYVDATNLPIVLHTLAKKISEQILILAHSAMQPEHVQTVFDTISAEVTLLTADDTVAAALETASEGQSEVVRGLLEGHLREHMPGAIAALQAQHAKLVTLCQQRRGGVRR